MLSGAEMAQVTSDGHWIIPVGDYLDSSTVPTYLDHRPRRGPSSPDRRFGPAVGSPPMSPKCGLEPTGGATPLGPAEPVGRSRRTPRSCSHIRYKGQAGAIRGRKIGFRTHVRAAGWWRRTYPALRADLVGAGPTSGQPRKSGVNVSQLVNSRPQSLLRQASTRPPPIKGIQ